MEHITRHPMNKWSNLCKLNEVDLFDLLNSLGIPIWNTKAQTPSQREVKTKYCRKCGSILKFSCLNNRWTVYVCPCSKDGTCVLTVEKLKCLFDENEAIDIIHQINISKTRSFKSTLRYWESKGYTTEEALKLQSDYQTQTVNTLAAKNTGKKDRAPGSVEFWKKKGYSEEESREKVKNNQRRGKQFFINKYGEEAGTEKFINRNIAWKNSLKKTKMSQGKSAVSLRLFDEIKRSIPDVCYGDDEYRVITEKCAYWVDCYSPSTRRIIEFYGDYWHANIEKYKDAFMMTRSNKKISCAEIREKDRLRKLDIEGAGYQVMVVWESEFKKDPANVVSRCIKFLEGMGDED